MHKKKLFIALYYERVSTTHDDQDESMENQRRLLDSYCERHPEIFVEEIYSERVSGKSDIRPEYSRMMERIKQGGIDFVIIKDFKRLNRSTEVSAQVKTMAKKYGFKFILLSTGQIYDPNAGENRMLYGFESLVNEEVVYRQSEYGRLAHRQKCEAKRLNRNNVTFGFAWDEVKKDIVIDEKQADIMKQLFMLYVFRDYGAKELKKFLATKGYYYSTNTIMKWLQETAYIGIFHINKKGSELGVGVGQKTKRFFNPKSQWIAVERPDLAFLDKEIFDLARRIRISRQRFCEPDKNGVVQGRFKGNHLFSAKVYCAECGASYVHGYADRKQTVPIYKDSFATKAKDASYVCPNTEYRRITEEALKEIVAASVNGVIAKHQECFAVLMSVISQVVKEENSQSAQIQKLEKELNHLKKMAEKTERAFLDAEGPLRISINQRYNEINEEYARVQAELFELQGCDLDDTVINERIEKIRETISYWCYISPESLDRKIIEAFISKIVIHKGGKIEVILKTGFADGYNILDTGVIVKDSEKESFLYCTNISYMYKAGEYEKGVRKWINGVDKSVIDLEFLFYQIKVQRKIVNKGNDTFLVSILMEILL